MIDYIVDQLIRDEDIKLKPYRDTVGKLTIGVGRNLDDVGISENEAKYMLNNDIHKSMDELIHIPFYKNLDPVRQGVLINMVFNMGITKLLGFKKMLAYLEQGDYINAANEMLASQWNNEVGNRSYRLSVQMITGEWQ